MKRNDPPPEDYFKVETVLNEMLTRLYKAQTSGVGRSSVGGQLTRERSGWEIIQINHQITRYIYDMFYKRKMISRELYDWLCLQKYCNLDLIAKWKRKGYEKLCCVNCILIEDKSRDNTCFCRVPRKNYANKNQETDLQCVVCGCSGCASNSM